MYNTIVTPKDTKDPSVDLRLTYLKVLCQSHDWYYRYSDDHQVFLRGTKEREEITKVANELRELGYTEEVQGILKEYLG